MDNKEMPVSNIGILKHLPNFLTCCNLFCGCVGIVSILRWSDIPNLSFTLFSSRATPTDSFLLPFPLVFFVIVFGLALFFDFLDGLAARLLKVQSAIGKDLDSLADVVSFGVLPGMIVYQFFWVAVSQTFESFRPIYFNIPFLAFLIPVFSALRLAKFNNDSRQTDSFIGLPTPANAILIASLPVVSYQYPAYAKIIHNPYFLLIFIGISCFLLVSEIRLFSFKFKSFSWTENRFVYIFLILSVILLAILQVLAVPILIVLYILLSILKNLTQKPTL